MNASYVLEPEFKMTAVERKLATEALAEHKIRKNAEVSVERPRDIKAGEDRDSKGRFVRCFEIRGGDFDILVFYNKRENWNSISWNADNE